MALHNRRKIVATIGEDQPLSPVSLTPSWCIVQALRDNTGYVAIGERGVRATDGEQNSIILAVPTGTPSQPNYFDASGLDLADVWFDATVAGEGVAMLWAD